MRKFEKYKVNLQEHDGIVYSYDTAVARKMGDKLVYFPEYVKYSNTTSKHVNYAARQMGLMVELDENNVKSIKVKKVLKEIK